MVELDNDMDGVINAIFTKNNSAVIYTASTGSSDDYEVWQADVQAKESPETLYRNLLFDAAWGDIAPFSNISPYSFSAPVTGNSFCPGRQSRGDRRLYR